MAESEAQSRKFACRQADRRMRSGIPRASPGRSGAALTGSAVRVESSLFLSGVVQGNHAFSRR